MVVFGYLAKLKRGHVKPYFFLKIPLIKTTDDVINFKIFLGSSSKAMGDRKKKEGKTKIQKFEYLENEKSFLDEIKNSFHSF